jgi:polyisoprenoid-binding protein YceI
MKLPLIFLTASLLLPLPAAAQQQVLPAQSAIEFVTKQMGVPVAGKFKQFEAKVSFDPAKPEASNIAFTVDTGSATLGMPETDVELPKSEWFHVGQFPKASFQSSAVKRLQNNQFQVSGKLTIKGVSSDVVVPVTMTQSGTQTTATGAFPIKRLTFRIGDKEWADPALVANEVQVKFRIVMNGVGKL